MTSRPNRSLRLVSTEALSIGPVLLISVPCRGVVYHPVSPGYSQGVRAWYDIVCRECYSGGVDRANALKFLGKQHLTAEVIIPGGLQALLLETEVGRLLLKQMHAQVSDGRHDGGCVALADAAFIFSKHHL